MRVPDRLAEREDRAVKPSGLRLVQGGRALSPVTPAPAGLLQELYERHAAMVDALFSEAPHPAIAEVFRRGDAFENA